jgi:Carboxypeptidase regulatory-like domain
MLLAPLILMATLTSQSGGSCVEVTISGTVVDSKGDPVAGLLVTITPTGKNDSIKSVRTKQDGSYEFQKLKITANFDIFFSHSKYDTAVVSILFQGKGQEINKVVYEKGEQRTAMALLDTLQAVEKVMVMALAGTESDDLKAVIANQSADKGITPLFGEKGPPLSGDPPQVIRGYLFDRTKAMRALAVKVFEGKK